MIKQRLKTLILVFLWGALIEDSTLFLMAWVSPDLWFRVFHHSLPSGLEIAFLRRSAGQWAAFAVLQALALRKWRRQRVWLAITAGARFSDLFTDVFYIISLRTLTRAGWILLLPPPFLNFLGVYILLRGYREAGGT